ncbi:MAG: hypothetical protein E7K20_13750 [Clostridium sp.]|uniref:hypothetical protein n=1 Tax=Clostridium sp. TaxID=1506 RepID=UPI002904D553|nr:hypothetical protein [Clostridium sp.]MDU1180588.1 hypothetical protein [Clostridium sp.]MDU1227915.1 hypothetical protein [Clostridium sp.]MDU7653894.1 hypothetical protein [Clostridium sp.]
MGKAIIAIDSIIKKDSSIGVNKLVVEAIKEVDNIRLTDKKEVRFSDNDIRKVIALSKDNYVAYKNLLNKGYIVNAEYEWGNGI